MDYISIPTTSKCSLLAYSAGFAPGQADKKKNDQSSEFHLRLKTPAKSHHEFSSVPVVNSCHTTISPATISDCPDAVLCSQTLDYLHKVWSTL